MSRWDRYVLRPRVRAETSGSETVPHIGPYSGPAPGGRLGNWDLPWLPPLALIYSPVAKTLIPEPFSLEAIPTSAAIANKLRGTRIPVPAPCRDGEVPSDSSPSTLLPPSMMRE